MSVLHKAVYKFNAILSKFQWHFFCRTNNPKIVETTKDPESQSNFVKEQKLGNHISRFQTLWQSYSNLKLFQNCLMNPLVCVLASQAELISSHDKLLGC